MDTNELQTSRTVVVDAPAEDLYDMVADVTRMGEWSTACTGATWDEGAGPSAGSWFTGHNLAGENAYDTRCEITDAQRPATIAWMQRGKEEGFTEWRWTFTPGDGGTQVTESWKLVRPFPPDRVPEDRMQMMVQAFGTTIDQTLASFKEAAEA